jgi:hypothetical protein
MCPSCAVRTPTGYLCKDCVRQHQKTFDTALWYDYLLGFGTTFSLSLIASMILVVVASFISFYLILLAAAGLGGGAGVLIANIVLRVINKRRSKPLFITCASGVVTGALAVGLGSLLIGNFFSLIWLAIYVVIVTPVVYTRIAGIQL